MPNLTVHLRIGRKQNALANLETVIGTTNSNAITPPIKHDVPQKHEKFVIVLITTIKFAGELSHTSPIGTPSPSRTSPVGVPSQSETQQHSRNHTSHSLQFGGPKKPNGTHNVRKNVFDHDPTFITWALGHKMPIFDTC